MSAHNNFPARQFDQVRRRWERLVKDQDPRINDVSTFVTDFALTTRCESGYVTQGLCGLKRLT